MSYNRGRQQSYDNQENSGNFRGRGRSQSNSRPYVPRGRGSGRNFFNPNVIKQEKEKKEEKEKQIEDKKNENVPKVDQTKKDDLINKGKQWFNKFWGGMQKKERANIQVEFNQDVDNEIYSCYESKLTSISTSKFFYNSDTIKSLPSMFKPYINLLIAIKLIKASVKDDIGLIKELKPLVDLDLKIPKMLGVIIDCFGKTDGYQDNVIRISGQNNVIKTCLMKCIIEGVYIIGKNMFNNMEWKDNIKFDDIKTFCEVVNFKKDKDNFYSADRNGIKSINEWGNKAIEMLNNSDIEVQINNMGDKLKVRLPRLDPHKAENIEEILKWEADVRKFFIAIKFDPDEYHKTMGLALVKWLPLRFIKEGDKSFGSLDNSFNGGYFKDLTARGILESVGWYNIDKFMDDYQLYENTVYFATYFKDKYEKILDDNMNMVKFNPSEFGTSSQIVTDQVMKGHYLENVFYKDKVEIVKTSDGSQSFIKMNEEEAIIGSSFKMNKSVKFKSGYKFNIVGSSNEIRNHLVSNDFK